LRPAWLVPHEDSEAQERKLQSGGAKQAPHGHQRKSFHLTAGYFELAILAKANLL